MKLIIRQYLASLRERGELDVVLPDLLSQMGLNVISRPGRGTRQNGVDVAAVGTLDGGPEKLYLFSIKAGDLTRSEWNVGEQSLKPSLDEILLTYVRNRIPDEHNGKPIAICITLGGDVREQVREELTAYEEKNGSGTITFEEWNGDRLSQLIQTHLLREELIPENARAELRKALAMLDEPDTAFAHFAALVRSLSLIKEPTDKKHLVALRQMSTCLWILFSWARDANNTDAAYRAAELALLHGWELLKPFHGKKTKAATDAFATFQSIFQAYNHVVSSYLDVNVLPYAEKQHALSTAIASGEALDVNLRLFDIVGRLSLLGIWSNWLGQAGDDSVRNTCAAGTRQLANALVSIISNNPHLLLPRSDEQAIDIWLGLTLLMLVPGTRDAQLDWLREVLERARFTYAVHGPYPCVFHSYAELLEHPASQDAKYREGATAGSVLYPLISLWAAMLGDSDLFEQVSAFKRESLEHCNFQFWYPDELSEASIYANRESHGGTLSDVASESTPDALMEQVFGECESSPQFKTLSAVTYGWWPLVLVACRLYRLPLPLHLFQHLRPSNQATVASPTNVGDPLPQVVLPDPKG
jgi:hypothetical protein